MILETGLDTLRRIDKSTPLDLPIFRAIESRTCEISIRSFSLSSPNIDRIEKERERKKEESSGFVSSNKRVSTIEGIWDELNRGNRGWEASWN